jgi:very-short-patch-repair endonuclease
MEYILILVAIVAIIYSIWHKLFSGKVISKDSNVSYEFKKRKYFMTSSENAFYKRLVSLYGDKYFIFPQVNVASILSEKINGQNWKAARNIINRKSVDYLICDKNYIMPLAAIELDDSSHDKEDRIKRDALVEQMFINSGMPLVRFKNVNNLSDYELKEKIESALNNSDKN